MKKKLPVIQTPASSLRSDGSRNYVHPADSQGRFKNMRRITFAILIVLYLVLPFVEIGGRPAVFLDLVRRKFYLFGASFNAQDFWLMLFILSGIALALVVVTTIWGRIWCGYACPQTVFLEGVYRPIERWLEGPRAKRIKRNAGPPTFDKIWRKTLKHVLYVLISLFISHFILSYFVSLPSLLQMVTGSPADHPAAFGWSLAIAAGFYFNFAWFREQMCLVICPYGRLQSTLTDDKTLVVGYDEVRGEPRGKKKKSDVEEKGDCVDCNRCVIVCPTGIDIRNGLQMDCIGCAACVDACDAVMTKLKRPVGLIRYDSLYGLEHRKDEAPDTRWRLGLYVVVGVIWLAVTTFAFTGRQAFEANLLRPPGAVPYVVQDDVVRNPLRIHIINKNDEAASFVVESLTEGIDVELTESELEIEAGGDHYVNLIANGAPGTEGIVRLRITSGEEVIDVEAPFVGP